MTKRVESLNGQVAVITGGGRGLGRAFAQALAQAGANVAITARTKSELDETSLLIKKDSGTVEAFVADVSSQSEMSAVVGQIEQKLGPIDILINNAAVITPLGYDWEVDIDEWWHAFEINVRGPYICTRLVLPGMMTRRKGRIINVSSIAAHTVFPYISAYCTSKAALTCMTNQLAAGVKDYGITVFALSPSGPTATKQTLADSPKLPQDFRMAVKEAMTKTHEVAESVAILMFLLSGQVDELTGRHISSWDATDKLISETAQIIEQDLYTLRLRV